MRRAFTYGRVVNTHNFDEPTSEPFKLSDRSAAFFATGNVAISRARLADACALLPEEQRTPKGVRGRSSRDRSAAALRCGVRRVPDRLPIRAPARRHLRDPSVSLSR